MAHQVKVFIAHENEALFDKIVINKIKSMKFIKGNVDNDGFLMIVARSEKVIDFVKLGTFNAMVEYESERLRIDEPGPRKSSD